MSDSKYSYPVLSKELYTGAPNRIYENEYISADKGTLEKYTDTILSQIDPMRSPSRSPMHFDAHAEMWVCVVRYYGLD